ncbi:class I SAM-dependent methyltransferase [Spirochaetota bacterium]
MDFEYIFKKAVEKRATLFDDPHTDCFRIFNSAADGIKDLTIDRYGDFLLVQHFNEGIEGALANGENLGKHIIDTVVKLPFPNKGILVKNRIQYKGNRDYLTLRRSLLFSGEMPPQDYIVKQNGINAHVNLIEGLNTGVFLDMREIRGVLSSFYNENNLQTMLNLFCYTALFSIHALKHGVGNSVNVDLSKSVLKRAKKNYDLNSLKYGKKNFIYGDALDWLRRFKRKGMNFSFIVLDPPTFSRNRKRSFSVKRNLKDILSIINDISLEYIFTSVNSFTISKSEYISYHPESWEPLFYMNESSDFLNPGDPYLKAGLWRCS